MKISLELSNRNLIYFRLSFQFSIFATSRWESDWNLTAFMQLRKQKKKAKKKTTQKSTNKTRFRMWSDALQVNQNQIPQTESSLQLHHWDRFLHLARMVCPDNEAVSVFRGVPLKPLALIAIPNTHVYIFSSFIWQFFLKRAICRF